MYAQRDLEESIGSGQNHSGQRYDAIHISGRGSAVIGDVYCSHPELKELRGDEDGRRRR